MKLYHALDCLNASAKDVGTIVLVAHQDSGGGPCVSGLYGAQWDSGR